METSDKDSTRESILEAKDSVVRIAGDVRHEIHHHHGPETKFCPCCHREIHTHDKRFECPECRRTIHEDCQDKKLSCCSSCAKLYQNEETQRERCGRLKLLFKRPDGTATVFLFAKRTIQWGRSRDDQIMTKHSKADDIYSPSFNDIVLRVMEETPKGVVQNPIRSKMVSRMHGAISVRRNCETGEVAILDWGNEGEGSSSGTWLGPRNLQPAMWHTCPDRTTIYLGKDPAASLQGLGMTLEVFRTAENHVAAVAIERDDCLSRHRYIVVVHEASIGLGPNANISFGNLLGVDTAVWGHIRFQDTALVYCPGPESPLRSATSSGSAPVILKSGVVLEGRNFRVSVAEVSDRDFYEIGSE